MSDIFDLNEQLNRPGVAREYNRLAPFFRLGAQLIKLRKRRGLTQKELAEKALTTQAVVSRLENVSVHCSLETIVRLAEALDAAVEVRLVPLEEKQTDQELANAVNQPCREDSPGLKSGFALGLGGKVSCDSVSWYVPTPAGFAGIPDPGQPRRLEKRKLEFA